VLVPEKAAVTETTRRKNVELGEPELLPLQEERAEATGRHAEEVAHGTSGAMEKAGRNEMS
jgi:hypothetical protein